MQHSHLISFFLSSLFAGLILAKVVGLEITTVRMFTLFPVLGLPIVAIIVALMSCIFATISAIIYRANHPNPTTNNNNANYALVSVNSDSDSDSSSDDDYSNSDDSDDSDA